MDNRIRSIINKLKSPPPAPIDRSAWKEFPVASLFAIEDTGKEPSYLQKDGDVNLVVAAKTNNGVTQRIRNGKKLFSGNKITFVKNGDGAAGLAFYQGEQFYATSSVFVLKPLFDNFDKALGLFVITTMRKFKQEFNHNNGLNKQKYEKLSIKLPEKDGKPDWGYMRNYITELAQQMNLDI